MGASFVLYIRHSSLNTEQASDMAKDILAIGRNANDFMAIDALAEILKSNRCFAFKYGESTELLEYYEET